MALVCHTFQLPTMKDHLRKSKFQPSIGAETYSANIIDKLQLS